VVSIFSDQRVNQGGVRPPWFTLVLGCVLLGLFAVAGPMPDGLVFDRGAIAAGEWWRLVTGHLVHADGRHLGANVFALMIIGTVLESVLRLGSKSLMILNLFAMLAIDAVLSLAVPGLAWYCGFSGVLNALFVAAVYGQWRETAEPVYGLFALGGLAKIAIETSTVGALLPTSSLPSITEAHFAGYSAGLIVCVVAAFLFTRRGVRRRSRSALQPIAVES